MGKISKEILITDVMIVMQRKVDNVTVKQDVATAAKCLDQLAHGPISLLGTAALSVYGTFISNVAKTMTVDGSVILNTTLPTTSVKMIFTSSASTVTVINAGGYHINYSIHIALGVGANVFLLVNGTVLTNST